MSAFDVQSGPRLTVPLRPGDRKDLPGRGLERLTRNRAVFRKGTERPSRLDGSLDPRSPESSSAIWKATSRYRLEERWTNPHTRPLTTTEKEIPRQHERSVTVGPSGSRVGVNYHQISVNRPRSPVRGFPGAALGVDNVTDRLLSELGCQRPSRSPGWRP
jgi:hypothetical protein